MTSREKQNLIWVAVGALFLAWLFRFEPPIRNLIVLAAAIYLAIKLWPEFTRMAKESRPEPPPPPLKVVENKYADEVYSLSVEDARRRAWPTLERVYALEVGPEDLANRSRNLGESLRALFGKYGEIRSRFSESRLGTEEIETYEPPIGQLMRFGVEKNDPRSRLIRIGRDADGNAILTRPEQDQIFVVRRARASTDRYWLADYPSIYHWLLMEHPDSEG